MFGDEIFLRNFGIGALSKTYIIGGNTFSYLVPARLTFIIVKLDLLCLKFALIIASARIALRAHVCYFLFVSKLISTFS